jgi:xanthine dehydrogenase molybdopterin-binding subunit B
MAAQSFVMPPKGITRGNASEAIAKAPRKVKGSTETGQQEQFYMEGQITYACRVKMANSLCILQRNTLMAISVRPLLP